MVNENFKVIGILVLCFIISMVVRINATAIGNTCWYTNDTGYYTASNGNSNTDAEQLATNIANYTTQTYHYPVAGPRFEQGANGVIVEFDAMQSWDVDAGYPITPYRTVRLVVAKDITLQGVRVTTGQSIEIEGSYTLQHAEESYPLSLGDLTVDTPRDDMIYTSDDVYPVRPCGDVIYQKMHGYTIVIINLYPLQYRPLSGTLSYFDGFTVELITGENMVSTFRTLNTKALSITPGTRGIDEVKKLVDNGDELDTMEAQSVMIESYDSRALPVNDYAYVAITSQSMVNANTDFTINDLIAHKQALGLTATIKTIESIYAEYTGVDDAEKLRNFIKDAYQTWGTQYVLLAGDINIIPMRKLWVYKSYKYIDHLPSDLYFQCLDGTFNYDNDEFWGEPTDGDNGGEVDLIPEIQIGRASAENANELANFVYKTITYDSQSMQAPYFKNILLLGEHMGDGWKEEFAKSDLEQLRLGTVKDGVETHGLREALDRQVDTLYRRDGFWDYDEVIARINSGHYGVINHIGHSNYNYVMKLPTSRVDSLHNQNLFLGYSQGCIPGDFERDCIGEHFTTSTRNGMFSALMNSRYGWSNDISQTFNREFWDAYIHEDIRNISAMNVDSKLDNIAKISSGAHRWTYYCLNLLGDPHSELPVPDIDNIAPSAPTNLSTGEITDSSVSLAWYPGTDDRTQVSYGIYQGAFKKHDGFTSVMYGMQLKAFDGSLYFSDNKTTLVKLSPDGQRVLYDGFQEIREIKLSDYDGSIWIFDYQLQQLIKVLPDGSREYHAPATSINNFDINQNDGSVWVSHKQGVTRIADDGSTTLYDLGDCRNLKVNSTMNGAWVYDFGSSRMVYIDEAGGYSYINDAPYPGLFEINPIDNALWITAGGHTVHRYSLTDPMVDVDGFKTISRLHIDTWTNSAWVIDISNDRVVNITVDGVTTEHVGIVNPAYMAIDQTDGTCFIYDNNYKEKQMVKIDTSNNRKIIDIPEEYVGVEFVLDPERNFIWMRAHDGIVYQMYGTTETLIGTTTDTFYTITDLLPGTEYYFHVKTLDDALNESDSTDIIKITTTFPVPTPTPSATPTPTPTPESPAHVRLTGRDSTSVTMQWSAPEGAPVAEYEIYEGRTHTIGGLKWPGNFAVNENDGTVWVIDNFDTVKKINPDLSVETLTGFCNLSEINYSAYDNAIYLVDRDLNQIIKISADNTVTTYADIVAAENFAIRPNDGTFWVTEYNDSQKRYEIPVLNPDFTLKKRYTVFNHSNNFHTNTHDNSVFFHYYSNGYRFHQLKEDDTVIDYTFKGITYGTGFTYDGVAWISNEYPSRIIKINSPEDIEYFDLTVPPRRLMVNNTDKSAWYSRFNDNTVCRINRDGDEQSYRFPVPNIHKLALNTKTGDCWIIDAQSLILVKLAVADQLIGTTTDTSFTIDNLTPNTPYVFTVKTKDVDGATSYAGEPVMIKTLSTGSTPETIPYTTPTPEPVVTKPATVSSPAAVYDGVKVTLTWNDESDNEDGFRVYRYNTETGLFHYLGSSTHPVYYDKAVAIGDYQYHVVAYNYAGESAKSEVVPCTVDTEPITPPGQPEVDVTGITSTSIALEWTCTAGTNPIASYEVTYGTTTKNATSTMLVIDNLASDMEYTFTVKAIDTAGHYSEVAGIATARTFPATPAAVYQFNDALAAEFNANTQLTLSETDTAYRYHLSIIDTAPVAGLGVFTDCEFELVYDNGTISVDRTSFSFNYQDLAVQADAELVIAALEYVTGLPIDDPKTLAAMAEFYFYESDVDYLYAQYRDLHGRITRNNGQVIITADLPYQIKLFKDELELDLYNKFGTVVDCRFTLGAQVSFPRDYDVSIINLTDCSIPGSCSPGIAESITFSIKETTGRPDIVPETTMVKYNEIITPIDGKLLYDGILLWMEEKGMSDFKDYDPFITLGQITILEVQETTIRFTDSESDEWIIGKMNVGVYLQPVIPTPEPTPFPTPYEHMVNGDFSAPVGTEWGFVANATATANYTVSNEELTITITTPGTADLDIYFYQSIVDHTKTKAGDRYRMSFDARCDVGTKTLRSFITSYDTWDNMIEFTSNWTAVDYTIDESMQTYTIDFVMGDTKTYGPYYAIDLGQTAAGTIYLDNFSLINLDDPYTDPNIPPNTGALSAVNKVISPVFFGAHAFVTTHDDSHVFIASEYTDSITWFELNQYTNDLEYRGNITNEYLNGCTDMVISPDGKYLYVASKYAYTISWYEIDLMLGSLIYKGKLPGSQVLYNTYGLTMSPDGDNIYAIHGGFPTGYVSSYIRNSTTGDLTYVDKVSKSELCRPIDIAVSPDGAHVYVVSHEYETISWFTRDTANNGRLIGYTFINKDSTDIKNPNSLAISPDGAYVYIAATGSANTVECYERDSATGVLTTTAPVVAANAATASKVIIAPDNSSLYTIDSISNTLTHFEIDGNTGTPVYKNQYSGAGTGSLQTGFISRNGNTFYTSLYSSFENDCIMWFDRL